MRPDTTPAGWAEGASVFFRWPHGGSSPATVETVYGDGTYEIKILGHGGTYEVFGTELTRRDL